MSRPTSKECVVCGKGAKWGNLCGSPKCSRIKRAEIDPELARERMRKKSLHPNRAANINVRYATLVDRRRAQTLYVAFRRDGKKPSDALVAAAMLMRVPVADALFMLRNPPKEKGKIDPSVEAEYRITELGSDEPA